MNRRRALAILAATLAAGIAAACGRRGEPEAPDKRKDSFPRQYPSGPPPA